MGAPMIEARERKRGQCDVVAEPSDPQLKVERTQVCRDEVNQRTDLEASATG